MDGAWPLPSPPLSGIAPGRWSPRLTRPHPCRPGGPVVPAIQEVDLTQDRASELEKLARGLKEHGLDPRDAFDWKPDRPIYPGLAAFDVDDAAIFFGRSEES